MAKAWLHLVWFFVKLIQQLHPGAYFSPLRFAFFVVGGI
jgi:hypothetical protein